MSPRVVRDAPLGGGDDVAVVADCEGLHETAKALLVRLGDGRKVWVPKSVIHEDSFVFATGGTGALVVQGWWARKEGLAK